MSCDCTLPVQGNDVQGIPVKPGAPLSTACERATEIGSIPEVCRLPWFTLVGGAAVSGKASSGGITNTSSFFKSRKGCYYSKDGRLSGSTCV